MKFAYPSGSRPLDGYTIKRGIGVGGFGEVYFATSDAGKEVALKHIQRNLDIELRGVTQCLNLKHVNLIALYDIKYDPEGEAWVVMEYVGGESLKDAIERHPQGMPREEVLRWFAGIAAGVTYLHDHGIVHRDLKPGNIFADDDIVKIGDYGLSKFISCSRRSGQTESVGTFHYMAPEIGRGVYGKEIDIYALGIILHEMLTGRVPFEGESSQEIIMKHLTAVPQLEGIPAPFAAVIRRSLAKDPAHRYSSVPEMCAALASAAPPVIASPAATATPVALLQKVKVVPERGRPVPPVLATVAREPIYILDEPSDGEGMIFGPLREGPASLATATAGRVGGEPIARSLRHGWRQFDAAFANTRFGSALKVLVLVAIAITVVANFGFLVPLMLSAGALYLIYYGLRLAMPQPQTGPSPREVRFAVRRSAEAAAREACRHRPAGQRAGELLGALVYAAVCCALLGLVALLLTGQPFDGSVAFWSYYAWLVITATVGCWALLVAGKVWESTAHPSQRRRGWMVLAGVLLGLLAFGLGLFLEVDVLHAAPSTHAPRPVQFSGWYSANGAPQLPGFLAYFAGLWILPRWWLAVDPLRRTRVGLSSAVVAGAWAWVLHLMLYFPQPAGVLIAVMISLGTQLAAPWWDLRKQTAPATLAA